MDGKDLRKRENRAKARAHRSRGRGHPNFHRGRGSRSGPIFVDEDPDLASSSDSDDFQMECRKATIYACSRPLPIIDLKEESEFTADQESQFAEIIAKLSPDEQTNYDFLVPVEPIESLIARISGPTPTPAPEPPKQSEPTKQNPPQTQDLNSWLDKLLG